VRAETTLVTQVSRSGVAFTAGPMKVGGALTGTSPAGGLS